MRSQNRYRRQPRPSTNDLITAAVDMQVRYGRRHSQPTETIREAVRTAINEALDVDRRLVSAKISGGRFEITEASFWMFRVILDKCGLDRSDQHAQERWHELVMRELDAALGQEDKPGA
jgi:hypothetical protein